MPEPSAAARAARTTARTAAVTGVLGVLFALLTPFLPVTQTTAALDWPQRGSLEAVAAPLVSYVPDRIDVTILAPPLRSCPAVPAPWSRRARRARPIRSDAACRSP
ncbi:hypothetical protein MTP03_46460 [Tsukamurella sp. PLM1]|nr:hypothetical protein MTP03_46460 [Tsukamurella sp. PLM1]